MSRPGTSMRRRRSVRLAALLLGLLVSTVLYSHAGVPPRQRWALFIGPGGSASAQDAVASQRALAQLLHVEFGYQTNRMIELYGERANLREIREAFSRLAGMNPGDTLLLYVLLPRVEAKGRAALQPTGGNSDQPWTLLTRNDLEQAVSQLDAGAILAVLPDCGFGSAKADVPYAQMQRKSRPVAFSALTFCPQGDGTDSHAMFGRALMTALGRARVTNGGISASQLAETLRMYGRGLEVSLQRDPGFADVEFEFVPERGRLDPFIKAVEDPAPAPGPTTSKGAYDDRIRAIGGLVAAVQSESTVGESDARDRAGATVMKVAIDSRNAPEVRARAVRAVGELGYRSAIPDLGSVFSGQPPFLTASGAPPEEPLRRAAVDALAQLGGTETLGPLQRALRDQSDTVRAAAVRALGRRTEPLPADVIESLLGDRSPDVKVAVLQVLSLKPQLSAEVIDAVRTALRDPSPEVRREAVTLLARRDDEVSVPDVINMLHSPAEDVSVRQAIAFSLARTVRPNDEPSRQRALEALVVALKTNAPKPVREGVLWSLGEIGGMRAEQALLNTLSDADPKLREATVEAIGKIGGPTAVKSLSAIVIKDTAPAVRAAAARALGDIGDPRAGSTLLQALEDKDSYVRTSAQEALGRLRAEPGQAVSLQVALTHPIAGVRADAIERLGNNPAPGSLELLIRALNDEDYVVRESAIRVLSTRADPTWIQGLTSALANDSLLVRMGAATALGRTNSQMAVPALSTRLPVEQNASVRAQIVLSLAAAGRGRQDVAARIGNEASNPSPRIRQAVAEALAVFEDEPSSRVLRVLSEDEVEAVRRAAIRSLRGLSIK